MRITTLAVVVCMLLGVGISFLNTSKDVRTAEEAIEACQTEQSQYMGEFVEEDLPEGEEQFREAELERCKIDFRYYLNDKRFWARSILEIESNKFQGDTFYEINDFAVDAAKQIAEENDLPVALVDSFFARSGETITDKQGNILKGAKTGFAGAIPLIAFPLLVLVSVLAASFIGAEYRAGTVENMLLWEPRRGKVLASKYLAGALSSAVWMAVLLSFLAALLIGLASVNGTFATIDSAFWMSLLGTIGRAALISGAVAVFTMAVATVTRYTAAAVIILLGWAIVSNIVIELLLKGFRRWEVITNANTFIAKGDTAKPLSSWCTSVNGESYCSTDSWGSSLSFAHNYLVAGLVVLIWVAVPTLLAFIVFKRRDIN